MIRTVLSVALAVALLAAAAPAMEAARVEYANARTEQAIDRLDAAGTRLLAESDPTPRTVGARRTVSVTLPERSVASAGFDQLVVPQKTDRRLTWRVDGGTWETMRPSTQFVSDSDRLRLTGGRVSLVLRPARRHGERVVTIARPDV